MRVAAFLVLFIYITSTSTQTTSKPWCQHSHTTENGFQETLAYLGYGTNSLLPYNGVQKLLKVLLNRVRCDQKTPQQCQCLKPDDLLATVGISPAKDLNEMEFNNISALLLPSVDNFPNHCTAKTKPLCSDSSKSCSMDMTSLQGILSRINENYRPGLMSYNVDGKVVEENPYSACISVRNKVFNGKTAIMETGVDQISAAGEMGRLSALVISKLLRGQCIVKLNQNPRPIDFTDAIFHNFGNNDTCTIQNEGLDRLIESVGGSTKITPSEVEAPVGQGSLNKHDISDIRKKCFNRSELLAIHRANLSGTGITRDEFIRLAPAMLQQLSQQQCGDDVMAIGSDDQLSQEEMYGYGTIIVLIINLGALPGGLFAPFRNKPIYKYILAAMMGVATGTLLGDGLLHLIPDALGLDITQATPPHLMDTLWVAPYKFKMFLVMGTAYLFFVMELLFAYIGMHKKKDDTSSMHNGRNSTNQYELAKKNVMMEMNVELIEKPGAAKTSVVEEENKEEKPNSPMSLAYMILIGDGIHNFADGLAIGAAMHVGLRSGLSTSIAIFCHEVPHELGDFAALLSVGWSYKKSLLMNFISGMTAFAGLYVGIVVSDNLYARQWIFAATAGMFLYISLTDLVPELLEYFKSYSPVPIFIAENLGFLIGCGIMVVITLYEDHIQV